MRRGGDLRYDLRHPCDDCPFLRASAFHEGIAAGCPQVCESIGDHRFSHTCHKTDPLADCETSQRYEGPLQHCRGALIMLVKTGRGFDLQIPFLQAAADGKLDLGELTEAAKNDTACYKFSEWLGFQADGLSVLDWRRDRELPGL